MAARVPQNMQFTRVELANWRNFRRVSVELRERAFLVGPNASGKSNFLDAFRFLRDLAAVGGGLQDAVDRRGGVSRLRALSARRDSDIAVKVSVGPVEDPQRWSYQLSFSQDPRHRASLKSEVVSLHGEVIHKRPNTDDESDPERRTQTSIEQVNVNQPFRELVELFASISYLHIVPQLIREPDRSVGKHNDPFGGDFLEQVASASKRTREQNLNQILRAAQVAVPQLQELQLAPDAKGAWHLRGRYQHWRPQGAWQTEQDLSDGTLRLFGLLWAVLSRGGPLLLEEPELSLHPEVVRRIGPMLARVQQRSRRQILISTHSPELLSDEGIGLDEVLLLRPEDEGTAITTASSIVDVHELLEAGIPLADVVLPRTRPRGVEQLAFFL